MKYLLIDGNNLACRVAFSQAELKNSEGISSGVHYGFFSSLISLKQMFPDYQMLISWDGHSQRRITESKNAVEKKIIKSGYKENRNKDDLPQPLKDFHAQSPFLKKALEHTGIPQIRMQEQETDDIINSYCKTLDKNNEIICVTGDEDYYQLLDDNVSIWNGGKQKLITKADWTLENGITPSQHVDIGALMGDTGDNIFGVYGVGEKTALELIKQHGNYKNALQALHSQLDKLRVTYPDITDNDEFNRLSKMATKSGKLKYPEITITTPFTGVALAFEDKKIKAISKTDIMILMFEERVHLAYSLKKMDIIPDLPEIKQGEFNESKLKEYFNYYDIVSLNDSIFVLK